jgi:hypothetical protein
MVDLETKNLRDDDALIVILSGLGKGRYDYDSLRRFLHEVIEGERIPVEEESSGSGEIPSLMQGVYRGFEGAWTSNVAYLRGIEPIGHRNDYILGSGIGRTAEFLLEEGKVSQEDYDSLRDVGKKVGEVIEENSW